MPISYSLRPTVYGLHRPQRSRQKPAPHVPLPTQCALSRHGSSVRGPGPVHVFTQMAPGPRPGSVEFLHTVSDPHARAPQTDSDGHTHGPLYAYLNSFTAFTTATMSDTLMFVFISGRLGWSCEIAFTGAPAKLLILLTNCAMSVTLG